MLYVPQNGIITPNIMRVEDSIWMIVWVALGGRGRLWGAMAGALLVNYAYSMTTSDMPSAWPFLEGGMFLAVVMLFPTGLIGLWDRFESEIASGARVSGLVTALAIGFLALLAEKAGLGSYVPHDLMLWAAAAMMLAFAARSGSLSGVVLAAITFFFAMEALGLVPKALQAVWLGVPAKYYILLVMLAGIALISRLGTLQQTLGRYYEPVAEH
jgi:hypothetical protein